MTTNQTTDKPRNWTHLPSQMDPAAYEYVTSWDSQAPSLAAMAGANPSFVARLTEAQLETLRKADQARMERDRQMRQLLSDSLSSRFGSDRGGQCDHCGAWIRYVVIYRHTSGDHIAVGETCAAERFGLDSRVTFEVEVLRKIAAEARATIAAGGHRARALADPETARLLAWATIANEAGLGNEFTDSLLEQWERKAKLSERQVEAGCRAVDRIAARQADRFAPQRSDALVPAPTGRVTVEGQVLSVKEQEGYTGGIEWKMLVLAGPEGAQFKVWATVPQSVLDQANQARWATGDAHSYGSSLFWVKGGRVRFDAQLTPSAKDPAFAIAKRPTKAQLVEAADPTSHGGRL